MKDIGIDLGTKNILIYQKEKGIVLNEASVIAIDKNTKKVIAIGNEACDMIGRTPEDVITVSPMKDGVIADFDLTEKLIVSFLKKAIKRYSLSKPRIIISVPSNITGVEKTAIKEMASRLGAKKVYVEDEVKVALIGAGVDISKPSGNMIIDIGGGTTDIAIISLGGVVTSSSVKIAGNKFDQDIINYVKDKYKLIIGDKTAEEIKIKIGTSNKNKAKKEIDVDGKDLVSGLPKTLKINSQEIAESLTSDLSKIIKEIKKVLEICPPELAKDIKEKGIILTGGGSMLDDLPNYISNNLKVPVFLSDNPLENVIIGTGMLLDNVKLLDY